mgnify:CR=1 FL=1
MKKIVATLALVCFTQAFAQVMEKPQLVEKVDTSARVVTEIIEIAAPIQAAEELASPTIANRPTPQFPGGQDSLDLYIKEAVERFIYADTNETFPWGESVYVAFEVAIDGMVTKPFVEMGYDALLDSAALDIVRNMPRWLPATDENGKTVVSEFRTVTLEVTPKIAEKIAVAQTIGTLSLSLRSLADNQSDLSAFLGPPLDRGQPAGDAGDPAIGSHQRRRLHQRDLAFQPVRAGRRFLLRGTLVDAALAAGHEFEMLDGVGQPDRFSIDSRLRHCLPQHNASRRQNRRSRHLAFPDSNPATI